MFIKRNLFEYTKIASDKQDSVKIAKFGGDFNVIEWKRSMKAFLRRDDYLLIGLQEISKLSISKVQLTHGERLKP